MTAARTNIVLIGMPGVGKSTVGVVLAKRLGYDFIDSDLLIQRQTGRRLPELIAEHGHDGFLAIEEAVNSSIAVTRHVIATGGSAVYGERAMTQLGARGVLVHLELPLAEVAQRVGELTDRGVAMRAGQTLADVHAERLPLYQRYAEVTIDCLGLELREVVAAIEAEVRR